MLREGVLETVILCVVRGMRGGTRSLPGESHGGGGGGATGSNTSGVSRAAEAIFLSKGFKEKLCDVPPDVLFHIFLTKSILMHKLVDMQHQGRVSHGSDSSCGRQILYTALSGGLNSTVNHSLGQLSNAAITDPFNNCFCTAI